MDFIIAGKVVSHGKTLDMVEKYMARSVSTNFPFKMKGKQKLMQKQKKRDRNKKMTKASKTIPIYNSRWRIK